MRLIDLDEFLRQNCVDRMDGKTCDECKHHVLEVSCERLMEQPTAEPEKEKAKRVLWTGWKGYRDTRYKCPSCKKPVKNDDVYCHRCGQRLMFPKVSFTPYVEGQKQEVIVRWDDE